MVNIFALSCALWFLAAGWVWIYFANVFFVFPFAVAGFFLWRKGRSAHKTTLNQIVGWMLITGVMSSLISLVVLMISN